MDPYGNIRFMAMTELGFKPEGPEVPRGKQHEYLARLFERTDVVVIDESHNFRTTNANRYKNLQKIVDWLVSNVVVQVVVGTCNAFVTLKWTQ